jgi:hypothetical protein
MQWSKILRASKERPLVACELSTTSGVRARSDLLLASKARPLASASEARLFACKRGARAERLWQRVAGIIRRCNDIMPRIVRNSGAMSMIAPFFTISRIFNLWGGAIAQPSSA